MKRGVGLVQSSVLHPERFLNFLNFLNILIYLNGSLYLSQIFSSWSFLPSKVEMS